MILIVIPTLNRPGKLRPLAENIRDATRTPYRVLYVTEAEDQKSWAEAMTLVTDLAVPFVNNRKHSYAGAVNAGYAAAGDYGIPFTHVFTGADDLRFSPGWDVPALAVLAARPELRVTGTNDLHSPAVLAGEGASHYLIDRRYIDETGGVADQPPGLVQCEAYEHGFTDREFTETARARGVWAPCLDSVVEHRHPVWGQGAWDDGYRKSQDVQRAIADGLVLISRRQLWAGSR